MLHVILPIVKFDFYIMEPTKKNRSLLRPRVVKKRGNPISISSRLISECEQVLVNIPEPEALSCINKVIASEESSSSTSERDNATKRIPEDLSNLTETTRPNIKRNVSQHKKPFVVSLPSIALEK